MTKVNDARQRCELNIFLEVEILMGKRKKNKRMILQRIRMRFALRVKRRYTIERNKKRRREAKRKHNSINRALQTSRRFHRSRRRLNNVSLSKQNENICKKRERIKKYLPSNLKYLTTHEKSPFNLDAIRKSNSIMNSNGLIQIPENFSILTNTEQSIEIFQKMLSALFVENAHSVIFDYKSCRNIDLSTQVLFDIILAEHKKFISLKVNKNIAFPKLYVGSNITDESVAKMIWSVGSPANLGIGQRNFPDVEKFKLRIYNNTKENDENKRMENKEFDTTEIADYVVNSLKRIGKELTPVKRNDLCTVIGEILINAEEHSTTKHRFSCGYFREKNIGGKHFGLFQLVILNFGQTIYEKFKSEDCPNKEIVGRMKDLSKKYTKKFFFLPGKFEEETLWTLYALQEGVTSISTDSYKRGNGSIRFIESFFNIRGSQFDDNISRMTIVSGNTKIVFDGSYSITDGRSSDGTSHKMMTFNNTGNIEEKPDNKYVTHTKNYFPGTMICAELLLNDDDIKQL